MRDRLSVKTADSDDEKVTSITVKVVLLHCSDQNKSTVTVTAVIFQRGVLVFCTLSSQLCAHHDGTSTHVGCSAMFKD